MPSNTNNFKHRAEVLVLIYVLYVMVVTKVTNSSCYEFSFFIVAYHTICNVSCCPCE